MFRKIRRTKNERPVEEAKRLLRENRRAAFSVHGEDGYPYTIPVNFYYDEAENRIYFHCAKQGHKLDAIRANDRVCFTTWDDGYLEEGDWAYYVSSCVVFGRAVLISDPAVTEEKVRVFARKYFPTEEEMEVELKKYLPAVQLVAIEIDHMTAKRIHER